MNLSLIHNHKKKTDTLDDEIISEPKEVESTYHSRNIQSKHAEEQKLINKVDSKNEKETLFKYGVCRKHFSKKQSINNHIA